MTIKTMRATTLALALSTGGLLLSAGAAHAESMKECSLKYQAAKKNNTLNGQDWKSFRAAQCGSGAPMAAADTGSPGTGKSATPASSSPTAASTPAGPNPAAAAPTSTATAGSSDPLSGPGKSATAAPVAAPAASLGASGNVVFPSAVSPKYASLTAGKARMKTCVDQYKANKADNGNGGLKWIQKGGGYYSACSKKLKGA